MLHWLNIFYVWHLVVHDILKAIIGPLVDTIRCVVQQLNQQTILQLTAQPETCCYSTTPVEMPKATEKSTAQHSQAANAAHHSAQEPRLHNPGVLHGIAESPSSDQVLTNCRSLPVLPDCGTVLCLSGLSNLTDCQLLACQLAACEYMHASAASRNVMWSVMQRTGQAKQPGAQPGGAQPTGGQTYLVRL